MRITVGWVLLGICVAALLDTEDTESTLQNIRWEDCGMTKEHMYNSFALHDNDYGSHVFLPYFAALLVGPFAAFSLSVGFEACAVIEKIYNVRLMNSSYTGVIDGMLQDPIAGFIGVMVLIIQAYLMKKSIHEIRLEFIQHYGTVGLHLNWDTLGFIVFTVVPLGVGHNVYEWMGFSTRSGVLHIWTMTFSFIVPLIQAVYVGSHNTLGFALLSETYGCIFCAHWASWIGYKNGFPDPFQSTSFWTLVACSLHVLVILYSRRTSDK